MMAVKSGAEVRSREWPTLGVWVAMRVYAGGLDLRRCCWPSAVLPCQDERDARNDG